MKMKKGFTLVELLVVIAIIAMLMGILMPALSRVRQIAYQMMCGTNLSGIGKAILVYSTDHEDEYPLAGSRSSINWSTMGWFPGWHRIARADAWQKGDPTITASFYLLVKYSDQQVAQFVCRSDSGTSKFSLSDHAAVISGVEAEEDTDCWDFGTHSGVRCSYSYAMPYGGTAGFPVGATSSSTSPIAADRNVYLDKNADVYKNKQPQPEWIDDEYSDEEKYGNASAHQQNGQNVLYNDMHTKFEKYPNVGIDEDNIYRTWPLSWQPGDDEPTDEEKQVLGEAPKKPGDYMPMSRKDAYLVNERQDVNKGGTAP